MTDSERVQSAMRAVDAPVCDNCLAMRAGVAREQVADVCQTLADHGEVDREQGTCTICGTATIVNSLIYSRNVPGA
jgi:hypothetical protein